MKHNERSPVCTMQEITRIVSLTPEATVAFDIHPTNLVDVALAKGACGVIFRAQPGAGKSHIIQSFQYDFAERTQNNVYIHTAKWSDSMRMVMGKKKPHAGSMTEGKRAKIADLFVRDISLSLSQVVRRRRGFRTHPRGVFTIAELPEGVVDESVVEECVAKGFLLVDIVPDPVFQRKAMIERDRVWSLPPGAVFSDPPEYVEAVRKSAPPEVMAIAIQRADATDRSRLSSKAKSWDEMRQVPVPFAQFRQHNDRYCFARRTQARVEAAQERSIVLLNPFKPPRAHQYVA